MTGISWMATYLGSIMEEAYAAVFPHIILLIKITHFYKHNYLSQLQKFWAYNQMHSWGEVPTVLLSGTHGDETFLRGPTTANMMCIHHGIDLIHELESQPNCYHYKYFQREKNRKLIIEQCKNVELKNK